MRATTHKLWTDHNRHGNDRVRLFAAVRNHCGVESALYPGSYIDIAASAVFPSVTYVDLDRRTPGFFADESGVREIVASLGGDPEFDYDFLNNDYRSELPLADGSFDLLVSLYAGFVSEHCTEHLRIGGYLLANTSHGDVAMASIDRRYELAAVVSTGSAKYRVVADNLDGYLTPKVQTEISRQILHRRGRGIGYTRSASAYLFRRVG